jgi:mannose-1-phosphate guanylyltransferase
MDHTYAVIMAGGGGTRLWPISRRKHPKHVLPLLGERTLFQITLDRLVGLVPPARVYVVTTAEQEQELRRQAPLLPVENYLIEPTPRGTASVIGLAAVALEKRDPQAVMLVLPADHFIGCIGMFHRVIRVAVQVARKDYLVTLGVSPTFPATGYGYIQRGDPLSENFDLPVYKMLRFTEKPDEEQARTMLSGGDHSWNSGMFIWRASRVMEEFSRLMPGLRDVLDRIATKWGGSEQDGIINSIWPQLKSETIDYGIMEHAVKVAVLPVGGLEWSDVGSWDSLFDVLPSDEHGNVAAKGEFLPLETNNSLVYSSGKKFIVTIGVNDLIVVESEDALLVCRRDQAQNVRQVIEHLKKNQREVYL